jgi:hypothetical protein
VVSCLATRLLPVEYCFGPVFGVFLLRYCLERLFRVHFIRINFVLHCTFALSKVRNPESKSGNNVLLFPGF